MKKFYSGKLTANAAFTDADSEIKFGFKATRIFIVNSASSASDVDFSQNGTSLDGEIEPGEPFTLEGNDVSIDRLWIKRGGDATVTYRIWAYAK